jgi:uncharacterized protein YdaU (DUF1376 family)
MALRDQPYLPLYVQDFLTDEKLMECSAQSVGVYIKVMCILHKQEEYGIILLKQKDKQSVKQEINFAYKLAKSLPWSFDIVLASLNELIEEKVLFIDGDKLMQKRMIKDSEISEKRAVAGKKGGDKTTKSKPKRDNFAQAKTQANSEIEYVIESEYENVIINEELKAKKNELTVLLCEKFGYSEMRFANKQREISTFVSVKILSDQDYDNFILQFTSYDQYKTLAEEKRHAPEKLIGSQAEQFNDSVLLSENWEARLLNFKQQKPKTKFDKVADNHFSDNPYLNKS